MKTSIKLLALGTILMGFGLNVNAQGTANAVATGELVNALSISNTRGLNFGRIVVGTAGTVVVAGVSASTRSGVGQTFASGAPTSASFIISGAVDDHYKVTLPASFTVTCAATAETMNITSFSCDVATADNSVTGETASGVLAATTRTFYVGGTLTIGAANKVGVYTNATGFPVTLARE